MTRAATASPLHPMKAPPGPRTRRAIANVTGDIAALRVDALVVSDDNGRQLARLPREKHA
jgi:hypothetical protein